MKLGLLFGTKSTECEVSVKSAYNVYQALDKEKYDISLIYLDKDNNFYICHTLDIKSVGELPTDITPLDNPFAYLKSFDVLFPAMHGKYGEDGAIQGLLEILGVPYVGCKIFASSACMDKIYTKYLVKDIVKVSKDIVLRKENGKLSYYDNLRLIKEVTFDDVKTLIKYNLGYPVFVKPSRFGSSVGVSKVHGEDELKKALELALQCDNEVLIEEEIRGRELECAVLKGKAYEIGEVLANGTFYSYDSKYNDKASKTVIPADIPKDIKEEMKCVAELVFRALNCQGLARVDFFLNNNEEIILNEINTMPGFTDISMYPSLIKEAGISYSSLLDILIECAIEK